MEDVCINGVNITSELKESFETAERAEMDAAETRMREAAVQRQALGDAGRSKAGELTAQVDPYWFHHWGRREGYEIWNDQKEIDRFARDTPEMQVRQRKPGRILVGVSFDENGRVIR